jgi:hypothetical protein
VAVHTSKLPGAGTDSNIKIVLIGDAASTEPLKLDTSANNFESGKVSGRLSLGQTLNPKP